MEDSSFQRSEQDLENIKLLQDGSQMYVIDENCKQQKWRFWFSKCTSIIYYASLAKPKDVKNLHVVDLTEVRAGCKTDRLHKIREDLKQTDLTAIKALENRCFSIHYGTESEQILNILAFDELTCARWVSVLVLLGRETEEAYRRSRCDPNYWLSRIFNEESNGSGYLSQEQCKRVLLERFNVILEDSAVEKYFEAADTDKTYIEGQPGLNVEEFCRFFQLVSHRPALEELFNDNAGENKQLDVKELEKFLKGTQGMETIDTKTVKRMIATYEGVPLSRDMFMTIKGFRLMMTSDEFDIRLKEHHRVNQPMDQPLNHYWIKSSHNTYLTTDQLMGPCSIEGFRKALKRNYGCIEMDLFPGPNDIPIIKHGKTLVTPILAKDALQDGIYPFLFFQDQYPVIISIEDHLTTKSREIFIKDLREIFGNSLSLENVLNKDLVIKDDLTVLPSPQDLRGKVIIKATARMWKGLVNICQARSFEKEFINNIDKQPVFEMCSVSELELKRLIEPSIFGSIMCRSEAEKKRALRKMKSYTASRVVRVYPGAHHQLSGNYNGTVAMNVGCQVVAMNIQTKCSSLAIYEGKFRGNGNCAYALKPKFLIDPSVPAMRAQSISILVVSGQNIPHGKISREVIDPYVSIRIAGEPIDNNKQKTHAVKNNGLNPVWNKTLVFDVKFPELAVILFKVKQEKKLLGQETTLGSFALPVTSLGKGYRHVPLQDSNLDCLPLATLWVKVSIENIL